VDQSKRHAQRIGNCGCAFGTTCIGTDYDSLLEIGDVELYVLPEKMAAVQIVDWDIEETLVLRVCSLLVCLGACLCVLHTMKIHGDNVVCAGACEKVGDQSAGLSNPLAVSHHGLKSRWLCSRDS
jgi:hypothetical protein